jgi:hypothetical protein
LTGGTSGAAGAATIAYAAPLMDQLQEQLAATLEKSGLSKEAAAATAKTITQTTALAVGTAVSGVQGGAMALNVDANNRQLTHTEAQRIKQLAKGDEKKSVRLLIASCALTKCSAEFAEGSPAYIQAKAYEDAGNRPEFKAERDLLSAQTDTVGNKLFVYSKSLLPDGDAGQDAIKRFNNTYGITTRVGGALQAIGGLGTGTVSSGMVVTGSAACAETLGAGCAVAAVGYTGLLWSTDQVKAGGTTFITGQSTPTLGGQLASNLFGVSPETGELLNGLVGLSPLAIDAALTNRAINAQAAATAQARGTYAGANSATAVPTGTSIPANSANAGVGLRNDLSIQAGVPTSTSNVWGASLDDLKQAFNTGGATITPGSARASSSGNSQILNVEGSSTGVVQVQYSPASTQSSHGGQYYKFTYADGAELKVIDPATYRVLGWPENGGKTTFQNTSGKVITYDPVSKTWR